MQLLILGYGYLGKELSRQAKIIGYSVTNVSRNDQFDCIACDISNAQDVERLAKNLKQQNTYPDQIVHCASSGGGDADAYREVYLKGCENILNHFNHIPLLYTSSSSVYAQLDGSTVDEYSATNPNLPTTQILLETEALVLKHHGVVARLSGIYGPDRSSMLRKYLDGTATLEHDGKKWMNLIHRNDAASAILYILQHQLFRGEIINITDNQPLTQLECYTYLAEHFKKTIPPSSSAPPVRKRAWTNKAVSNHKLLSSAWSPQFPSFKDFIASIDPRS